MLITNIDIVPRLEIKTHPGLVNGGVVRAKDVGRNLIADVNNCAGGESRGYTGAAVGLIEPGFGD